MDKGRLVDYASPYELLNDKQTIFYDFVNKLDQAEKDNLNQLAKDAYFKKSSSSLNKAPEQYHEVSLAESGEEEELSVLFSKEEKEAFIRSEIPKC